MAVPKLRFPEFSEEWENKRLYEVAQFLDGKRIPLKSDDRAKRKGPYPYYGASGIIDYVDDYIFDEELVLLGEDGANIINRSSRMAFLASGKFWVNNHAHVIKGLDNIDQYFLSEQLERVNYAKYNTGTAQPKLNQDVCKKIPLKMPKINEQQKIASFLSKVDQKIEKLEKKQELWETYKKGIMQQIFSQKLRFKDENGEDYPDWAIGRVKDVLVQEIRKVEKPETGYWRLGLRSHAKGTFHEFVDDPNKIAMDYLYLVKENDLILNITFAWEHAIALASKEDEDKLVSHRFPTYKFFDNINPLFYKYYVTLPKFKYELGNISPGGAGRNRVMRKADFLEIIIPIPSTAEQNKIVDFLSAIYNEVEEINKELEINRGFKKGLLQQMFC